MERNRIDIKGTKGKPTKTLLVNVIREIQRNGSHFLNVSPEECVSRLLNELEIEYNTDYDTFRFLFDGMAHTVVHTEGNVLVMQLAYFISCTSLVNQEHQDEF